MPLEFACPHCGERTRVDDQYSGLSGPCFSCGKLIFIPLAPGARRDPSRPATADDAPPSPSLSPGRRHLGALLAVVAAGAVAAIITATIAWNVLLPGMSAIRHSTQRRQCIANLKKIGQALELYHQQHGSYPPAYTVDAAGKPLHSWRTLILPQLGEESLYRRFKLDEPHDSVHNKTVAERMPSVYACPSDPDGRAALETAYVVIVGPRTLFPPDGRAIKYDDSMFDPRGTTVLVVEASESGIFWTAPEDLSAIQLRLQINPTKQEQHSIRSLHAGGAHALFADGQVRFLSDYAPGEVLSGVTTRDGREPLDVRQLEEE